MIRIRDYTICDTAAPFIIAEMSANHNQKIDRAFQIIEAAAQAGVHAIKLQTYSKQTTLDHDSSEFVINDKNSLWNNKKLHNLYEEAFTPWEWHKPLMDHAKTLGLIAFSTPFDLDAVDFLETLDVPCYKVGSFENNYTQLIRKVARTGKPLIISLGLATLSEVEQIVYTAKAAGAKDLILLKCTSAYPAKIEDANLRTIPHLRDTFGCQVGLSDHTLGSSVAVASVALGAAVIEKHFTLSRSDGGLDAAFSMEPEEMKQLVRDTQQAKVALGKIFYGPTTSEQKSLTFRRSIYFVDDMAAGDKITTKHIKVIRPGYGLQPEYYEKLIGLQVSKAVKKGTPVTWDYLYCSTFAEETCI